MKAIDQGLFTPAEPTSFNASPDSSFPRAGELLSGGGRRVVLLAGVPFSSLSISKARCDLLPAAFRRALWSFSTFGMGIDLAGISVEDAGDVVIEHKSPEEDLDRIENALGSLSKDLPRCIVGGDNSITAPSMLAATGQAGGLLTFDAHHDVRDYKTAGLSNGSGVRVLMDSGVPGPNIWQIGIAPFANSREYSEFAAREGVRVVGVDEVHAHGIETHVQRALAELSHTEGIYVDVDIDVLDRALAPGAPASLPGGLQPAHLLSAAFICGKHPKVKALDIVEVDPERDVADTTVRLAALVFLYFLAGLMSR